MKKLFLRIWDSPTFTTWANRSTKSLRFLLVTPLLVTRFSTEEIAAWYLFSSLTFFGTIIHDRVILTFNRMIAFGMAGAQDLSSIENVKIARGDGKPHWDTVKRAYGTVGFLTLTTASVAGISGLALGGFSLSSILAEYSEPGKVWAALFIVLGGQTFSMCFSQYMVTIQGMGLVALSNRWSCLFSLLSVGVGFAVLSAGGGIIALAVSMQAISLLNILRMKLLVNFVHNGVLKNTRSIVLDREVLGWAWPAFWRGLFSTIMNKGVLQIGAVVYARYASVESVAAYLFSFNILRTISSFSEAPLISMGPRLSSTMAKGDLGRLRKLYSQKATQAQWLFAAAAALSGVLIPAGLGFLKSNTNFLGPIEWATLILAYAIQRYVFVGLRLPALGNKVIYVKETAIAGFVSILIMGPAVVYGGYFGLIAAMYLPTILALNFGPFVHSAKMVEIKTVRFIFETGGMTIMYLFLAELALIVLTMNQ